MDLRALEADTFQGFPKDAFTFLGELSVHNDREWFNAHRDWFERAWRTPLEAFVADAEPILGPGKVFRIHRDIRFSKDKTPYKTHASVVFEGAGIAYYLHLEERLAFCATGMHEMAKDQCQRLYEAVLDDAAGQALERLVADLEARGVEIGGEALKTAARGYPKDHPRARFLRHKGLTATRSWRWDDDPPAWLFTPEALHTVRDAWNEASALNAWLTTHVAASSEGPRWVRR